MTRDLVSGCALFVFSVIYYLTVSTIPMSQLADSVGAQGMPKSYGIALGILSLLLIAQTLIARRKAVAASQSNVAERTERSSKERYAALRAGGMLAMGAAYVIVLPWLGYVLSLTLLIVAAAWYQERAYMKWLVPTALAGAGIFWLIFVEVLQIAEPAGIWPSLFE